MWVTYYNSELRVASSEYHHSNSPGLKRSKVKDRLANWHWLFSAIAVVLFIMNSWNQVGINSDSYCANMETLLKRRIRHIRPERTRFLWQHDNTLPYKSYVMIGQQCCQVENVKYQQLKKEKLAKYQHTGESAQIRTFLLLCIFWAIVPLVIIIIKLYGFT